MAFVEFEKLYCFCPLSPRSFSFWSCGLMNNRLCDESPDDRLVPLLVCILCWSFLMLCLLIRCYSCQVYFGLSCCLSSHQKLNLEFLTFPSALSACLHVSSLTSMWGAVLMPLYSLVWQSFLSCWNLERLRLASLFALLFSVVVSLIFPMLDFVLFLSFILKCS